MGALTYRWEILGLKTVAQAAGMSRVVRDVTFRRTASDGGREVSTRGTITVPPPEDDAFVPYEDLTEEQVADWVAAFVDADRLDADLAAQFVPAPDSRLIVEDLPWAAPPPPPPDPLPPAPPDVITPRQMILALLKIGLISADEALAAAQTGAVPAAIEAMFASLPSDDAIAARITWAKMTTVERTHPLVQQLGALLEKSQAEMDAFFFTAGGL